MRLSCAADPRTAHPDFMAKLEALYSGFYASPTLVRAVYEGPDEKLGKAIIDLFEQQPDHDIALGDLPLKPTAKEPERVPRRRHKKRGHGRYRR